MVYFRQKDFNLRKRAQPATPATGEHLLYLDSSGALQQLDDAGTPTPVKTTLLAEITDAGSVASQDANAVALTGGSATLTGVLKTSAGGLGYATGAGGTVTQSTSKSTAVTLNKLTGKITTSSSNITANSSDTFTLNNSEIEAEDHILVQHFSGGTSTYYIVDARVTGAGTATITIRNIDGSIHGEVLVLKFTVIKAVAS